MDLCHLKLFNWLSTFKFVLCQIFTISAKGLVQEEQICAHFLIRRLGLLINFTNKAEEGVRTRLNFAKSIHFLCLSIDQFLLQDVILQSSFRFFKFRINRMPRISYLVLISAQMLLSFLALSYLFLNKPYHYNTTATSDSRGKPQVNYLKTSL